MYTIKEAAARAGISVPLARAWERRYGVVEPARTPAGYRLYDETSIARLRAMRHLVDSGWSPSAAAASLESVADSALPAPSSPPGLPDAGEAEGEGRRFADRFVAASAGLDARQIDELLDESLARGSFEQVAEQYLLPALDALGDAWADGRVDVAAEHAASHAVLRRLGAAYQAAGRPRSERRGIIVGMPPGARHELGALTFAVAARRAGLPVLYLGADLPVRDWVEAARRTGARAAVIGAVTADDRAPAIAVAQALQAAVPGILVAFGGRGAPDPEGFSDLGEVNARRTSIRLPHGLVDAVDRLSAALRLTVAR